MSVELKRVHHQRLRGAVEAARKGAKITFRVNPGEPCTLVWVASYAPGVQRTITSLYGQRQEWIAAVQAAFDAELAEVQ